MALVSFATAPVTISPRLVSEFERSQAKAWEHRTLNPNLVNMAAQKAAPMRVSRWIEKELLRGSSIGIGQRPHVLLSHRGSQFSGDTFELTQARMERSGQSVYLRQGYRSRFVEASNRFHGDSNSPRHLRIRRLNQLYNSLEPSKAADAQRSKSESLSTPSASADGSASPMIRPVDCKLPIEQELLKVTARRRHNAFQG